MEEKNTVIEDNIGNSGGNSYESDEQLEAFDIYVKHGISLCKTSAYVIKVNWLCQVYDLVAIDLGFRESAKCIFENEQGQRTNDSQLSLEEFGITKESTITIYPY